ncbi:unnamed protein product [Linum trigynum]|uniref:Uncharacterized protein n=1 Tax=Linum trigynum TaxID=586398 RepID=A0AAV2FVG6_9ROSI
MRVPVRPHEVPILVQPHLGTGAPTLRNNVSFSLLNLRRASLFPHLETAGHLPSSPGASRGAPLLPLLHQLRRMYSGLRQARPRPQLVRKRPRSRSSRCGAPYSDQLQQWPSLWTSSSWEQVEGPPRRL